MVARPATRPEQAPSRLGLPRNFHSRAAQVSPPAAAAKCVAAKAQVANRLADKALPALKPNQPTQSMAAPRAVYVKLCGGIGSLP